jgi:hypothetical protein
VGKGEFSGTKSIISPAPNMQISFQESIIC